MADVTGTEPEQPAEDQIDSEDLDAIAGGVVLYSNGGNGGNGSQGGNGGVGGNAGSI